MVCDAEHHVITTEPMVLLFLSLAAGLWVIVSHAQMLGLRLWCLAEISDFSERWKGCPQLALVYFLSLQSTYGRSFAFQYKSGLRNALLHSRSGCLQLQTLSSALLPVTFNTVYD